MAKDQAPQGTPLAIIRPTKPINEMNDAELTALADQLYEGIAAAHKPTGHHPPTPGTTDRP